MDIMRSILLRGSRSAWLRNLLPRYAFVRTAVTRFMPGEDVGDALDAAERLRDKGIAAVLTHLGENIVDRREAGLVVRHYCDALEKIGARALDCDLSVKLTQLGIDLDAELCRNNLATIAAEARTKGRYVWVDMEGSAYTTATIALYQSIVSLNPSVGICLQSYLRRTPSDLERLLPLATGVRLVKGAYAEPPEFAFHKKKDTDGSYFALAVSLLHRIQAHGIRVAIGTHDTRLIRQILDEMGALNIERNAVEFHMLYGIQSEEQLRLAREGYRVRVLISYGAAWFAWYMRRLAERPANVMFVLRSLASR